MSDWPIWYLYVPGVLIVAAAVVIFRWLVALSRRLTAYGERIAHLEGPRAGPPTRI